MDVLLIILGIILIFILPILLYFLWKRKKISFLLLFIVSIDWFFFISSMFFPSISILNQIYTILTLCLLLYGIYYLFSKLNILKSTSTSTSSKTTNTNSINDVNKVENKKPKVPISNNYQCEKCKTVVTSSSKPNGKNCPSFLGGHNWINLGEAGDDIYQCSLCSVLLKSKKRPDHKLYLLCNGKKFHSWHKLN